MYCSNLLTTLFILEQVIMCYWQKMWSRGYLKTKLETRNQGHIVETIVLANFLATRPNVSKIANKIRTKFESHSLANWQTWVQLSLETGVVVVISVPILHLPKSQKHSVDPTNSNVSSPKIYARRIFTPIPHIVAMTAKIKYGLSKLLDLTHLPWKNSL